ncbi:uncharacterized protein LOC119593795 [Penaeus monodon]|uniref:uncharacterized protein LOC119593795 n=1 Tax=Penaeus monodon TaxID=6687 RepID=UPI0018A7718C|nr:uncharacterized protein LOC119593795 [Penaeus monodon]
MATNVPSLCWNHFLLALVAFTHAPPTKTTHDFSTTTTTPLSPSATESLIYIGVIFVGLLLFSSFLGLFGTSVKAAQPSSTPPLSLTMPLSLPSKSRPLSLFSCSLRMQSTSSRGK